LKVLALDLSRTRSGWSTGEPGKPEKFGHFKRPTDAGDEFQQSMYMAQEAVKKAKEEGVGCCVAEDWVRGPSPAQMLNSAVLRGVVAALLKDRLNIDTMYFTPGEWRAAAGVDQTNLPKKNKRLTLKTRAITICKRMGHDVKNDDEAEAILILMALENLLERPNE